MSINFTETVPFVDGIIEGIFDMLDFLLVGILNDTGDFFHFIEFGKHIVDIIENGLVFGHFLLL